MTDHEKMELILLHLFRVFASTNEIPKGFKKQIYDGLDQRLDGICSSRSIYEYVRELNEGQDFNLYKSSIPTKLCLKILQKEGKDQELDQKASQIEVINYFVSVYQPLKNLNPASSDVLVEPDHKSPPPANETNPIHLTEKKSDPSLHQPDKKPRSNGTVVRKRERYFWKIVAIIMTALSCALSFYIKYNMDIEGVYQYYGRGQKKLQEIPYIANFQAFLDAAAAEQWSKAYSFLSKNSIDALQNEENLKYAYRMTQEHRYHYYMIRSISANRAEFVVDLEFFDQYPKWPARSLLSETKIDKAVTGDVMNSLINDFTDEIKHHYSYKNLMTEDSVKVLIRKFLVEQSLKDIISKSAMMEEFGKRYKLIPQFDSIQSQDNPQIMSRRRNCNVTMVLENGIWKLEGYSSSAFMGNSTY